MSKSKAAAGGALVLALTISMYWEGKSNQTYIDMVGVKTICYGHTGPDVHLGDTKTDAECKAILERDLEKSWAAIDKYVTVDTEPWVRAAAADFSLNVGIQAFKTSSFLRLLNEGKTHEACNSLLLYARAGTKKNVRGLINRRVAERHLCLGEPW